MKENVKMKLSSALMLVGLSVVLTACTAPLKRQMIDLPMDENGRREICLYNLESLLDAKQEWARDTNAKGGQLCPKPEVLAHRYFRMYKYGRRAVNDDDTQSLQVWTAKCPKGGTYIVGTVGQRPKCSVHGDLLRAYDTKIATRHSH